MPSTLWGMVKSIGRIPLWRSLPLVAKVMLGAHVLVVASAYAVFVVMMTDTGEVGANIGAGLVGLMVLGLGLPWSGLVPLPFTGDLVDYLVLVVPALVNVGLHLLVWRWALARRSRRS